VKMSLAKLQSRFQRDVLEEKVLSLPSIVGSEEAAASERLQVYVDAYRLRLLESLSKDFPGVRGLAGPARFEGIARAYIATHASGNPSIRWYGRHMADFLQQSADDPILAEMARFEWAQGETFDAPDAVTAALADFATISPDRWPGMKLAFHPSIRRLDLEWNVPEVWQSIRDGADLPEPKREPAAWLVWRRDLIVRWRSLERDEALALDAARAGACFGELCERLAEHARSGDAATRAAGLLKRWVSDGLLTATGTFESRADSMHYTLNNVGGELK
jgi:hypothetical protein